MYETGDILASRGHSVDYWFRERLEAEGRPRPALHRFAIPFRISRMLRQELRQGRRWDVVEIHEPMAAPSVFLRRKLPPLVLFSFGLEDRYHAAMLDYRRRKGLPITFKHRWSHRTISLPAGYATRHAAHVICSNSTDVDHLRRRGVPAERLTRHHSGADQGFLNAGEHLPGWRDRRGILFLGSWIERKGILDLVPALVEVLTRHPQETATLAGGDVPEEVVLSAFPASLRSRIRVLPRVESNQELIALYRSHAVFVLPSYFEGQPLVMVEAAALGLALVMTPVCGMADFLEPERNGLAVEVANPGDLARQLCRLIEDPALAERLGLAARETARRHSWAGAADKIERAYYSALAQ